MIWNMLELTCAVPIPQTAQELEQAIQQYQETDWSGFDLFCHWQAIRDAALEQFNLEPEPDFVPGEDSY